MSAECGVARAAGCPRIRSPGQLSDAHRAARRGVAGPPDLRGWPGARVKRLRLSRLWHAGCRRRAVGEDERERVRGGDGGEKIGAVDQIRHKKRKEKEKKEKKEKKKLRVLWTFYSFGYPGQGSGIRPN